MPAIEPFNRLKQCRDGPMLYNVNDAYVGRSFDLYGEFSFLETEAFAQILQPSDNVIDVGANIGAHTIFFAKRVGPIGRVLAFEPQRIVYQTLCANVALNSLTNVFCYQLGLGDRSGTLRTPSVNYATPNNFGGIPLGEYANGENVEITRLDRLTLPSCKLVKIDVEGMEQKVLEGATGLIRRHKPVLYVENDRPQNSDALIRFIKSLGYRMYWHRPPLYNPNNFFKNAENVFGNIVSLNLLCFHSDTPHVINGLPEVEVPV